MRALLKTALAVFVILFIVSGVFTIIGTVFSLTFGIIGTLLSLVWKLVTNPVVLVLIIVCLVYRSKRSSY